MIKLRKYCQNHSYMMLKILLWCDNHNLVLNNLVLPSILNLHKRSSYLFLFCFAFNKNCICLGHIQQNDMWNDYYSQANLHIFSPYSYHFLVIRAPEIYSLSKFPVFKTMILTIINVFILYIGFLDLFILHNFNSVL